MQVVLVSGPGMDSILVTIPAYTDKTKLTPFFTHKGKSVSPASGTTLDFSAPVVFTVTAEDGSQLKYTVVVKCRGAVFFGTNENRFFAGISITPVFLTRKFVPPYLAHAFPGFFRCVQ